MAGLWLAASSEQVELPFGRVSESEVPFVVRRIVTSGSAEDCVREYIRSSRYDGALFMSNSLSLAVVDASDYWRAPVVACSSSFSQSRLCRSMVCRSVASISRFWDWGMRSSSSIDIKRRIFRPAVSSISPK